MAWRFKASKYRNAAPIVPKPENYVRDVCVGSYQTYGNNIAASGQFMAFNWDHVGSSVAVLPIDDSGRKSKLMPLLHAHSDTVTDLSFSPFHDGLLATGSQDCLVKIWHIPETGLAESLNNPECTFSHKQRRVETVGFHPTADFLLHSTSYTSFTLWDLMSGQDVFVSTDDHSDVIQSVSWKKDGTLVATSAKDKQVRIFDPRSEKFCIQSANSHQSIKDSRVVWLGDANRILTTGFNAQRLRQVIIRDLRNFSSMEKELQLDCSTGILIPLYDSDTGMLFLAGKGDTTIGYLEVSEKEPYLIEGIRHSGEQTKGACLVPKRALNVMQGEVNRIMQLTSNSVIPIAYQVPRKTYRDFHADLYPDTTGYVSHLSAEQWITGKNLSVPKISLDPKDREKGEDPIVVHRGPLAKVKQDYEQNKVKEPKVESIKTYVPKVITSVPKTEFIIKNSSDEKLKLVKNEENVAKTKANESKLIIEEAENIVVPPKPLPRASRTGSICEPMEEPSVPPKPVARSRTNSCVPVITSVNPNMPVTGGYKPRLGPKPFSPPKFDESESFDKVFNVPAVPGSQSNGIHEVKPQNDVTVPDSPQENKECPSPEVENFQIENNLNGALNSGADEENNKPKTPSTAERRKIFENHTIKEDGETVVDANETNLNFERGSVRNSIAERRKIYERSQSVQDGSVMPENPPASPTMFVRRDSFKNRKNEEEVSSDDNRKSVPFVKQQSLDQQMGKKVEFVSAPTPKRISTVFGKVSKFRHLKGTAAHKSFHIENVRNLSRQIPGECDGFQANSERVAIPLSGPGGKIAIYELNKTGKLPDGVIPALVHGSNIMDFAWDPFDNRRLAVACDDGIIKLWKIPEGGLVEPTNEPEGEIRAHSDKIYFIKFHPCAKDVLASGSYDMTVRIWDLIEGVEKIILKGHTEQIFSFAWSPCGKFCATVSKDGKTRIYNPRLGDLPLKEGNGPAGSRGARIVWALDGNFIVATGFDKVSERQIMAFRAKDLSAPVNVVGLDVSPAILMPFYDEDSSTLFLTGKGDSTIYTFEITEEPPYICPLSHHRCSNLSQGLSFLPKNVCDVGNVEFAKALRLTNNSIEPLSFTVPRIKTDLFQDDLFPPTRVTWQPLLGSSEWFSGKDGVAKRVSLQPAGMEALTATQNQQNAVDKQGNKTVSEVAGAKVPCSRWDKEQMKAKQEEIQKSVSNRLQVNMNLEQDDMEGVDEREWEE